MRGATRGGLALLAVAAGLGQTVAALPGGVASVDGPMLRRLREGPMRGVGEIVFAVRVPGRDHWYVNFGSYSDHSPTARDRSFKFADGVYWGYGEGAGLYALDLRSGRVRALLEDGAGGIRDPQVHYDGARIVFAYRPGGTHVHHLYEIGADGRGLRRLTNGPDDDIEPAYLPGGGIVFVSSRCRRFVNCWYTRVGSLHVCDEDGGRVRMISSNIEHDNTPWVMPDGRILYMRWEYVDRSQVHFHHLWTSNPDGSGQTVFYGNSHPGLAMLDAKPIPNPPGSLAPWSGSVIASFSPGHGRPEHAGHVTVVDPRGGPDDLARARQVSVGQPHYRDPYPITGDCFLAVDPRGVVVMDGSGATELIYALARQEARFPLACHEPRPLASRLREPALTTRARARGDVGRLLLADVRVGRSMAGIGPGEITSLLVLEQLPKPVNFSGGMEPLTVGGSFTLSRILGTVPVEPDGSAHLEAPAMRSLYFVALDRTGLSVKRMQSFVTVQPGETIGCVGCHEHRVETPLAGARRLIAARRAPSRLEPVAGVPDVIDYPRDVQPVLDRHCVGCHDPEHYAGRLDLSGGRTNRQSVSYLGLFRRGLVRDNRNRPTSALPPRTIGSGASPLLAYLEGEHHGAAPDARERALVRLWIDTSATYPGTYAALGSGMVGSGVDGRIPQRCVSCHIEEFRDSRGKPARRLVFGRPLDGDHVAFHSPESFCNLDRPAMSILLRAPLARAAGGFGLCGPGGFAGRNDEGYRRLLEGIENAGRDLARIRRFDMAGFRPNAHYLREMRRFGILNPDSSDDTSIDPYDTDRRYWSSFWLRPDTGDPMLDQGIGGGGGG